MTKDYTNLILDICDNIRDLTDTLGSYNTAIRILKDQLKYKEIAIEELKAENAKQNTEIIKLRHALDDALQKKSQK